MKKDVKLYNMILPPFMLFFFAPTLWICWFYVFCNTAIAVPNRDIFLLRIKKLFRQQKCVRCGYYCHCKGCNYFLLFRKSFIVKWHTIIKSKNKNTAKQNTADNKQNSVDAVITGVVGCKIYSRKNLFSDIVALVIFRTLHIFVA